MARTVCTIVKKKVCNQHGCYAGPSRKYKDGIRAIKVCRTVKKKKKRKKKKR